MILFLNALCADEMAKRLNVEDLSSVPSTNLGVSQPPETPASGNPAPSSGLNGHTHTHIYMPDTQTHHVHINKKSIF